MSPGLIAKNCTIFRQFFRYYTILAQRHASRPLSKIALQINRSQCKTPQFDISIKYRDSGLFCFSCSFFRLRYEPTENKRVAESNSLLNVFLVSTCPGAKQARDLRSRRGFFLNKNRPFSRGGIPFSIALPRSAVDRPTN